MQLAPLVFVVGLGMSMKQGVRPNVCAMYFLPEMVNVLNSSLVVRQGLYSSPYSSEIT